MPSKKQIEAVWEKASTIRGKNPNQYRRDAYGNEIYKAAYGTQGTKGWEVDHKNPRSKGGSDSTRNLQALQTAENRKKSNAYPY
ncbi:HNH endonuclease [Vibrio cyclitrophicus]|nr:HNH endonuclease signature motif containing protein [Vibrio cyclitrophicus]UPR33820.1 HNH endonuclease [Vibrio cyclitrophicus]